LLKIALPTMRPSPSPTNAENFAAAALPHCSRSAARIESY
jgi:hypothetical protein